MGNKSKGYESELRTTQAYQSKDTIANNSNNQHILRQQLHKQQLMNSQMPMKTALNQQTDMNQNQSLQQVI
jgi:hypothetical protein